jgi:hypothetical protein
LKKVIILIGVFILFFETWRFVKASLYHSEVSFNDVQSVSITDGRNGVVLTKEQQKKLIEAFNSAKFIDDNDRLALNVEKVILFYMAEYGRGDTGGNRE